jgi:hydrogenase-4 component E
MSGTLAWIVVGLGLLVLVVRRRSLAVAIVTLQALLLATKALEDASTRGEVAAGIALGARAVALAALFLFVVSRTREPRPVRAGTAPLVRAGAAVAFALALIWLVPRLGLGSPSLERAVLALVAFGLVTAATRRATLFQVIGIVLVENGLALAALRLPGGSALIEFGVAFDLMLVALVAAVFHERIFAEFGAGDTAALRSLRDHP